MSMEIINESVMCFERHQELFISYITQPNMYMDQKIWTAICHDEVLSLCQPVMKLIWDCFEQAEQFATAIRSTSSLSQADKDSIIFQNPCLHNRVLTCALCY